MTLSTPAGPLVIADNPRDLSARRYFLFQQAWLQELNVGSDLYAKDGHLARLGMFLGKDNAAARAEYNNLVLAFRNLSSPDAVDYLAATLAPLVHSIGGVVLVDDSQPGLADVAGRLGQLLSRAQLVEAVEESKKNFAPN